MCLAAASSKGMEEKFEGVGKYACFGESEMMHWHKGLNYL